MMGLRMGVWGMAVCRRRWRRRGLGGIRGRSREAVRVSIITIIIPEDKEVEEQE